MTFVGCAESRLGDHQHVEDDNRRQAKNHRPDAERPQNVFGSKSLLFREWIFLSTHDGPAMLALVGTLIGDEF
jgi:hypothetical protein